MAYLGVRVDLADLVSFYIHAGVDHRVYIWQVRVCRVVLEEFVSLYVTRRSNTELERVDILSIAMDDYFLSENNYLWRSFYCMFNVFPFGDYSWSSYHFSPFIYL